MNDVSNKASGLPVRKGGNRFPSLSQLVQQQKECLLLDVSGSMAEWVEGGRKIDVIFVGRPDDEKAIAFLRRLCKQSGGQYGATVLSLEGQELLTQQIAGLLEGGQ